MDLTWYCDFVDHSEVHTVTYLKTPYHCTTPSRHFEFGEFSRALSLKRFSSLSRTTAKTKSNISMDFSWSTPLRRNDQHICLPLIPNEIYLVIFEYIAPTSQPLVLKKDIKTFSALALVCRFFCAVALPRIFERVVFSSEISPFNVQATRRAMWARQIVANIEPAKSTALYVKEFHFKHWVSRHTVQQFFHLFSALYCRAMAHMSNIRTVVFYKSFVKEEHWGAMAVLKRLEHLTLSCCTFIECPPVQELSVRTVKLVDSPTSFTLWPIATDTLRTLETDDLRLVLRLATAHQLAIEHFVLIEAEAESEMELLLQVLELLPGLESVALTVGGEFAASPFISKLSLKKLFTRLRSFTLNPSYGGPEIPRHDAEEFISAICDGPGTLPSLERLDLLFYTSNELTTTIDMAFDRLEDMILPAFPNIKCIRAPYGEVSLEKDGWKRSESWRNQGTLYPREPVSLDDIIHMPYL